MINHIICTVSKIKTTRKINKILKRNLGDEGMELVTVAILIFIAIAVGVVFKDQIGDFVDKQFTQLTTDFKH